MIRYMHCRVLPALFLLSTFEHIVLVWKFATGYATRGGYEPFIVEVGMSYS